MRCTTVTSKQQILICGLTKAENLDKSARTHMLIQWSLSLEQLYDHRNVSAELQVQPTWLFDLAKCHTVKTPAGTKMKMRGSHPGVIATTLNDCSRRRSAEGELRQSHSGYFVSLLLQRKLQGPRCRRFYTKMSSFALLELQQPQDRSPHIAPQLC